MKWLVLLVGIGLCGCTGNTGRVIYHPREPEKVEPVDVQWKVNNGMVGLSWGDFQKLGIWLRDVERYVKEQRVIINYYRDKNTP